MSGPCRTYYINLCYEAYFGKAMEVTAGSLAEACEFAMVHADDGSNWKDTLGSSSHWIECVDYGRNLVPEEYSAEANRCGGAELVALRLHEALRSLVQACERDSKTLTEIGGDVERARAALSEARL